MNTELWKKISEFDLDQPVGAYGFSTRLAAENYWTKNFTIKAVEEYKKFFYLAVVSKEIVSPSEIVDAVWHQHLIFSRSYNTLCNSVGKYIQHVPSIGLKEEQKQFEIARQRTRDLYIENFGVPPVDVWGYNDLYKPLNLPKLKYKIRNFIIIGILAFLVLIAPCYSMLKPVYMHIDSSYFLQGYIAIFVGCLVVLEIFNRIYLRNIMLRWRHFAFVYDLTPFELVYLKTGTLLTVIHGIVNEFIAEKKIVLDEHKNLRLNFFGEYGNLECDTLLNTLNGFDYASYPAFVFYVKSKPAFINIAKSMNAFRKYFMKSKAFGKLFYLNFIVLLFLIMLATVRLMTGIMRDKPVVFISATVILSVIAAAAFLWRATNLISSNVIPRHYKKRIVPKRDDKDNWDWRYFLLGSAVLISSFIPLVNSLQRDNRSGDGGGGCGGSCGGGREGVVVEGVAVAVVAVAEDID